MKRKDLFVLQKGFELTKDYAGLKFAYARVKNKKKVEDEISSIREAYAPDPRVQEFEVERMNLLNGYAELDETGNVIVDVDGRSAKFESEEKKKEFVAKFEELRTKYKDVIESEEKKNEEYMKFIEEDIDLDLIKVSIEDLPSEITGEQLEYLFDMIKEG